MVKKSARTVRPPEPGTRERILVAAGEVFAATGFAGARVDEIADRAGVNKAMLYYYVGDKEQLYAAVLVDTIERALISLRAATEEAVTPSEKLQCLFDTFSAFGSNNPWFIPVVLREVASGGATLPDEMLLRMSSVFRLISDVFSWMIRQPVGHPPLPHPHG
jgi:AcrR family transcriptional regulator